MRWRLRRAVVNDKKTPRHTEKPSPVAEEVFARADTHLEALVIMTNYAAGKERRLAEVRFVAERLAPLRHLFRLRADQAAASCARLGEVAEVRGVPDPPGAREERLVEDSRPA